MTTIKDIYNYINEIAPYELQESYDNSGLCIGNGRTEVKKALIALDVTKIHLFDKETEQTITN